MKSTSCEIVLKSFSGASWYRLSLNQRSCTCAQFRATPGTPCKHLNALGIYREKRNFIPSARPTFSQALSGLVKSIRLRRPQDAVYWLFYLDSLPEDGGRFRIARRLLIGSAEDGHSIAVMKEVAKNFPVLTRSRTDTLYLAAEVLRICKAPNWWRPESGGKDYIYCGLLAERMLLHYQGFHTVKNMAGLIEEGITRQDKVSALAGVMGLSNARLSKSRQAEYLANLATKQGHEAALQLIAIHLSARTALSGDNNFLSQAAWMMAGGHSPVADLRVDVLADEARESVERAREMWQNPKPIPRWCCDGLHSAGDDERFMGVWFHMYAACLAYEHYGRLNPDDAWKPEFYCYDGLTIATEPPAMPDFQAKSGSGR
jgi:hypothetical protein